MSRRYLATSLRVLIPCCLLVFANAAALKVTTVAGGYRGDGKPATSASLYAARAVTTDSHGNIYIADSLNCRIRKVNAKNVITTFAGTGICGYGGDGGPATSAQISYPTGLAIDSQGSLLFSDYVNQRIRKVASNGTITTIAGNGVAGYSGDGGPAAQAEIFYPSDVAIDSAGNIYIADSANSAVRMVDRSGIIHTVAGDGTGKLGFGGDGGPATSAKLAVPQGVRVDTGGDIYIADTGNSRVRKVDSGGTITTVAGNGSFGNTGSGGPATSASIGNPQGVLIGNGVLYISTLPNIWAVDLSTQVINLIGGNTSGHEGFNGDGSTAASTSFFRVMGMAFDSAGNLLVADSANDRIRKIDSSGIVTTVAGGYLGDGGPAALSSLNLGHSSHSAFDSAGNLYIADSQSFRVRRVSTGGTITTFAGNGTTGYSGDGGPATEATFGEPEAVAADNNGNIFISDDSDEVIRKVDNTGTITTFSKPIVPLIGAGLATDKNNNLYVADGFWAIWRITPDGSASVVAGTPNRSPGYNGDGGPAVNASLNAPTGIAVDAAGNLYIADSGNERVRKVYTNGIISTLAGTGAIGFSGDGGPATAATLFQPADVAVDAKGNVYVVDQRNARIRVINSLGTIQTLAGTGNTGYNGNGLPATQTNLSPTGIAVGPKGFVYFVSDDRVRKIH